MVSIRGVPTAGAAAAGAARGRPGVEGAAFAVPGAAAKAAGIGGTAGIDRSGGIDAAALLALQAAEDATDSPASRRRNRQAQADGAALLDALGLVQRGLLAGATDPVTLQHLAALAHGPEQAADPLLARILAEIRLRAHIELARCGSG